MSSCSKSLPRKSRQSRNRSRRRHLHQESGDQPSSGVSSHIHRDAYLEGGTPRLGKRIKVLFKGYWTQTVTKKISKTQISGCQTRSGQARHWSQYSRNRDPDRETLGHFSAHICSVQRSFSTSTRKVDKANLEGDARLRDEGPGCVLLKRASYEAISRARSRKCSTGPRGGASRSNPSLKGCSTQRIETQHKIAASASASATIATNWNRQHAAKRTTPWNSLMLP